MKVLHLTTHLNVGGITSYIQKLGPPLRSLGVEISVLSSGGECRRKFVESLIPTFELPIKTKSELSPALWLAAPAAKKILTDGKFDLIHAHTRVTQVLGAYLSKAAGIPMVTTCHGFYKNRFGRRIFPAWGDRAIAISDGVAEHLRKDFGLPEAKVVIVNNGVDIEFLEKESKRCSREEAKRGYGFQPTDPVIGIVSRLVEDKGHEYLIRAMALLQKDVPNVRLLVVGDGRCRESLKKLTKTLNLSNSVLFCGNLEDVVMPLRAMDIFTLPATWREGFGLSMAEAMACSIPAVVTNIWSLNILIKNQETGILIEPKRADLLAEAMKELILNPQKARLIGVAGRNIVRENFSLNRMAEKIAVVYKQVVGSVTYSN